MLDFKQLLKNIGTRTGTEHLFVDVDKVLGNVVSQKAEEKKQEKSIICYDYHVLSSGLIYKINSNKTFNRYRIHIVDNTDSYQYFDMGSLTPIYNQQKEEVVQFVLTPVFNIFLNFNYMNRAGEPAQNYTNPDVAGAFLGAAYNYWLATNVKLQIHQFSTFARLHSLSPKTYWGLANAMIDIQYAHKDGDNYVEAWRQRFYTSDAKFDIDNSRIIVDEFLRFGFSKILTEKGNTKTAIWADTTYSDGGHNHHLHMDGFSPKNIETFNSITEIKQTYFNGYNPPFNLNF